MSQILVWSSSPIKGILQLARQTQHLPQPDGGEMSLQALEPAGHLLGAEASVRLCGETSLYGARLLDVLFG